MSRPIYRGDCYWHDIPLPGEAGRGAHAAFVVSNETSNRANGFAILASSHRGAKQPWAFALDDARQYRHNPASARPVFDASRMIGVEQAVAVALVDLNPVRDGQISIDSLNGSGAIGGFGADSALRVQFALPGYADDLRRIGFRDDFAAFAERARAPQYSVWDAELAGRRSRCVVISNNKHNHHAQHVQILEVAKPFNEEVHADGGPQVGPVTLRISLANWAGTVGNRLLKPVSVLSPRNQHAVQQMLLSNLFDE